MAYLIFMANGEEYERRELRASKPIVIGRAPDCDVAVRDIILSRHHCRIERTENGKAWQIVDLHSKNGTQLRGQPIETHVLRDGDELRIGRSRLTYRSGPFVAAKKTAKKNAPAVTRPVDPHEALAGTVTGMVLCEPGETQRHAGMPMPQPRPVDPNCFVADGVYDMINEIASSSWDSIQTQASEPTRMQRAMPVPGLTSANRGTTPAIGPLSRPASGPSSGPGSGRVMGPASAPRPKARVSFDLQAAHGGAGNKPIASPPPLQSKPLRPPSWLLRRHSRRFWIATTSVTAAVLFIAGWITLAVRASSPAATEPPAETSPETLSETSPETSSETSSPQHEPSLPAPSSAAQDARPARFKPPLNVEPDRRSGTPDVSVTSY
ncbi:MAG: FHA domain-containing protein [Tepidisphaeraceae bacterium]